MDNNKNGLTSPSFYFLREQLVENTAVVIKENSLWPHQKNTIFWYLGRASHHDAYLSKDLEINNAVMLHRDGFRLATIEDIANAYSSYANNELDADIDMLFETIKIWMQTHGVDKYIHAGYEFNLEPVHIRASRVKDDFVRLPFYSYETVDIDLGMKLSDKEAIARIKI